MRMINYCSLYLRWVLGLELGVEFSSCSCFILLYCKLMWNFDQR